MVAPYGASLPCVHALPQSLAGPPVAPLSPQQLAVALRGVSAERRAGRSRDPGLAAPAGGHGRRAGGGPDRCAAAADVRARRYPAGRAGASPAAAGRPRRAARSAPRAGRHGAGRLGPGPSQGARHVAGVGLRAAVRVRAVAPGGAGRGHRARRLRRAAGHARRDGHGRWRRGGARPEDLAGRLVSAGVHGGARRYAPAARPGLSAGAGGRRTRGADQGAAVAPGRRRRFPDPGTGPVPDAAGRRLRGGTPPDRARSPRRGAAAAGGPVDDARAGEAGESR